MTPTNSQGKPHAKSFLDQKAHETAYLSEMAVFLDLVHGRPDFTWTPADAAQYRSIWTSHFGPLSSRPVKPSRR